MPISGSGGGGGAGVVVPISTANGGFGASMAAASGFTKWTAGSPSTGAISSGDLPTHTHIGTDVTNGAGTQFVPLASGGTNANLSATGPGALQQATNAGAVTSSNLDLGTAANTARLVNLANAQKLEVYATTDSNTSPANYTRLALSPVNGTSTITVENAGTGTDTGLNLTTAGQLNLNAGGSSGMTFNAAGSTPLSISSAGAVTLTSFTLKGTNTSLFTYASSSEQLTLNTGAAFTDTAANLLPAGALILGVSARITTTITTAVNWSLGDATVATRFTSANSTMTAGTVDNTGFNQFNPANANNAGPLQAAAAKLRVTLNANPGAGVIRIVVFYLQMVGPTS